MSGYDDNITPLKRRFFIAAGLVLILAVAGVSLLRSRRLLAKTHESLTRAQSGLDRVKAANANRRLVLATLKSQFGQSAQNSSPEIILYGKVDQIKARLNPDDMTITAIEKKGGEASLQYTLAFNNPDFNTLLNAVNYLQEIVFPLTPVSSIAVAQSEVRGVAGVSFKVSGKIITSEKTKP
jgi:hypothetical protein